MLQSMGPQRIVQHLATEQMKRIGRFQKEENPNFPFFLLKRLKRALFPGVVANSGGRKGQGLGRREGGWKWGLLMSSAWTSASSSLPISKTGAWTQSQRGGRLCRGTCLLPGSRGASDKKPRKEKDPKGSLKR